jgi:hypothetical protein
LLETHSHEESPKSLKFEDAQKKKTIADQSVKLAEWTAELLTGAEQLAIKDKPVAPFPLPWSELAFLLLFAPIDEKTLKKLEPEKPMHEGKGPDAPSAHRRPEYPLSGCIPAEAAAVLFGSVRLALTEQCGKPPSDTGVMPQKILLCRLPTAKTAQSYPHALEKNPKS